MVPTKLLAWHKNKSLENNSISLSESKSELVDLVNKRATKRGKRRF